MQDDGWYASLVGKSSSPWQNVQKLAARGISRREPLLRERSVSPEKVGSPEAQADENDGARWTISRPTVPRRPKSFSDFYDTARPHHRHGLAGSDGGKDAKQFQTEADFESWYSDLKGSLIDASNANYTSELRSNSEPPNKSYRLYRNQLLQTEAHLDSLLKSAKDTLNILSSLTESFKAVEEQTTEFRGQCEEILVDQKKTSKLAEDITENLQYYNYLEPITKRLNAPGAGNLIRRAEFSDMLANIDTCLDYMQAHPKQREAPTYTAKYRLLLTRALTLIRNYFTSSLRDISADVTKRMADRQLNDSSISALLYAKFRVGAPELKKLGQEIQKRAGAPEGAAPGTEGEYQGLLNELHQSYSTTRGRLLQPIVAKKMTELSSTPSTSSDLVQFARSGVNFIRGLCSDEYDLWGEWFPDDQMLYPFLESLCEPLYDRLRPKIIHETKIIKLCEFCTLIQTRYLEDSDLESDDSDGQSFDFGRLIQPALHDAQDRLVFLAQVVLRNDIQYFKPKPEHLDYPRRASRVALSGSRNQPQLSGRKVSNGPLSPIPKNPTIVEEDGIDREPAFDSGTGEYYPTLRRAVWLLSRIYRLVHSTVFDSLAHEIVHHTVVSLNAAATQISTRASPTDANLFLLSHLLALKHHILAFDIEYAATDVRVDFGAPLTDLRDAAGFHLLNPARLVRAALGGALVPRVVTDMRDARVDVDDRLRAVIGALVAEWGARMTAPVRAGASPLPPPPLLPAAGGDGEDGRGRPEARGGEGQELAAAAGHRVRETVEREAPLVRRKVDEYVHDRRTRDMLLRAVLEDVLRRYAAFLERTGFGGGGGRRKGRGKGKGREDEVWEEDVFGEWAGKVFGLEGVELDGDENESS